VHHSFALKLCAVMTAFVLSIGAVHVAAAEPPASSPLRESARIQVQQLVKATHVAGARRAQDGTSGDHDDPGTFFKTKRGATLLVLAAAGIGYMWYSKFHDRIHSQERERVNH